MNNSIDYSEVYYRLDNKGNICAWHCAPIDGTKQVRITYGILGGTIISETANTDRKLEDEVATRIKAKRKSGYLQLHEVKDNVPLPVEEVDVIAFLKTYLTSDRKTIGGIPLPMLAKTYDSTSARIFKDGTKLFYGQPKINGLRCNIYAVATPNDMFKPVSLVFMSREGTIWNSLKSLEEKLLNRMNPEELKWMLDNNIILDGELYIPGRPVNLINSYVKDPKSKGNDEVQFWVYDLNIPNASFKHRYATVKHLFVGAFEIGVNFHINNRHPFVIVPVVILNSHVEAVKYRDKFIMLSYEGLMIRDPDAEYQDGKRNSAMYKYKKHTDGKFLIVDIIPEGGKRPDLPLLVLRNDINSATFKVRVSGTFEYQRHILENKQDYIGHDYYAELEYGERSGVEQVPFHVKDVKICK